MKKSRPARSKRRKTEATPRPGGARPHTLSIDIGGTGIKMLVVDADAKALNERSRELTPKPAPPQAVLAIIKRMLATQPPFDRVSVGFPGVVVRGVVKTAPNLGTKLWHGINLDRKLEELTKKSSRVINDADLQGYGVISGRGVELVLTLGTGLGSALYLDGRLVPNLELGHHPFRKGRTYEDRISDRVLKRIGKRRWSKRVRQIIEQLEPILNYDVLLLGGGNVEHLKVELPENVKRFENVAGMKGGVRLWDDPRFEGTESVPGSSRSKRPKPKSDGHAPAPPPDTPADR